MQVKTAEFITSSSRPDQCPQGALPEYAFIGRSNVGKSSLINMLTGRKALAATSSTPGKTMLINHFLIDQSWYLVDLPGYGYAQRSKKAIEKLQRLIEGYILNREQLISLFVLVDSRLEPQKKDLEFIRFLGENGVPFGIIFTQAETTRAPSKRGQVPRHAPSRMGRTPAPLRHQQRHGTRPRRSPEIHPRHQPRAAAGDVTDTGRMGHRHFP